MTLDSMGAGPAQRRTSLRSSELLCGRLKIENTSHTAPVATSAARGPSICRQAHPPPLRRWHRALGLRDHGGGASDSEPLPPRHCAHTGRRGLRVAGSLPPAPTMVRRTEASASACRRARPMASCAHSFAGDDFGACRDYMRETARPDRRSPPAAIRRPAPLAPEKREPKPLRRGAKPSSGRSSQSSSRGSSRLSAALASNICAWFGASTRQRSATSSNARTPSAGIRQSSSTSPGIRCTASFSDASSA